MIVESIRSCQRPHHCSKAISNDCPPNIDKCFMSGNDKPTLNMSFDILQFLVAAVSCAVFSKLHAFLFRGSIFSDISNYGHYGSLLMRISIRHAMFEEPWHSKHYLATGQQLATGLTSHKTASTYSQKCFPYHSFVHDNTVVGIENNIIQDDAASPQPP